VRWPLGSAAPSVFGAAVAMAQEPLRRIVYGGLGVKAGQRRGHRQKCSPAGLELSLKSAAFAVPKAGRRQGRLRLFTAVSGTTTGSRGGARLHTARMPDGLRALPLGRGTGGTP